MAQAIQSGQCVDLEGQAGDLPGSRVAMQDPAVDGMIDDRDNLPKGGNGFGLFPFGHECLDLAGHRTDHRHGLAVPRPSFFVLLDILECSLVGRQRKLLSWTFVKKHGNIRPPSGDNKFTTLGI